MSETFARLDRLLGANVSPSISHIPSVEEAIEDCLDWNRQAFAKWMKINGCMDERDVRDRFRRAILEAERELSKSHAWGDLTQTEPLERAVKFLISNSPQQRDGAYLTNDSALLLLAKHPPVNLLKALQGRTIEDAFYRFTPLDVIALSRHTESHEWQDAYVEALDALGPAHFEQRPVRVLVVEREFLRNAGAAAERPLKPWSSSHNKETGTLTFYTFDAERHIETPHLLLTMLFFHYYFEVVRAARLASGAVRHGERPGESFARIIRSTRRTFSFNNPNVHSEALHWEDAISYINVIFPKLGLREYVQLLPCGEFATPESPEPLSLNLIDHVWDVNLDNGSGYFEDRDGTFLYHFREAFWSEIVQTLRRLSKNEMRSAVFGQLELDDLAFTERILSDADAGIDLNPATPPWANGR